MRLNERTRFVSIVLLALTAATWSACNDASTSGNTAAASSNGGKLPITTKSEEAKNEYLQGQDLADKLKAQDSLAHFDRALALDPDFATAEMARANSSPTAKDVLEHVNKSVALADKVSEGEKLAILANQAGVNGNTDQQKQYLDQLVAAYPSDERVHFNLGNYYAGQQQDDLAIEQFKKTVELAPNFSGTYNSLGYAYRAQGDYANAEQAFKKYVELIPTDPNPYDSYAELLMKMGRFDDSMAQYQKALAIDSNFSSSRFGLAADLMYLGKSEEATNELQKMIMQARSDGETRLAYFGMAVVASDRGKFDQALLAMDKEYAVAEKKNDVVSMAADLQTKGNILFQIPKYDEAQKQFDRSFQIIDASSVAQGIKDNAKLLHHFNMAAISVGKKDLTAAKMHAEEFRKGAEAAKNPAQIRQAHDLAGRIALAEKNYDGAIAEILQSNLQNPQNLFRLYQAYQGKGDTAKAQEYCAKAAGFNSLPQLNYAFVRVKAQKIAGGNKA